jgi:hypothetical protein
MNKLTLLGLAGAAIAVAGPATTAQAAPNLYAGAGYTHIDERNVDLGALTGRLGVRMTQTLGVEAEGSVGVHKDKTAKLDNTWGVYGVGFLPLTRKFDLLARAGFSRIDEDGRGPLAGVNRNDDGLGLGVGAQVKMASGWGLRGDFTHHDGDRNARTLGASLVRSF